MIYTLILALMDKLEAYNETRKTVEAETKARLEREREMEELVSIAKSELSHLKSTSFFQRRFEGTKVTVQSFLNWKIKFEQEMKELKGHVVDTTSKKLTGKNSRQVSICIRTCLEIDKSIGK